MRCHFWLVFKMNTNLHQPRPSTPYTAQYRPSGATFPATPANPRGISGRRFPLLQSSADAGTPSVPSSTNLTRILTLLLGIQNEYQPPITTPKHHQHPAISAFQRVGFPAVPPTPTESLASGSRCCNPQRMRYVWRSHGGRTGLARNLRHEGAPAW